MNRTIFQMTKILNSHFRNAVNNTLFHRKFAFKSALSLDKLYPSSSLKLTTPSFVPEDPNQKFSGFVPLDKLTITYSCSSGPGGQNVNKVHTKVDLRFIVQEALWLDPAIRQKLMEEQKNKITKEGFLVIKSDVTRYQQLNLADCLKKLREMIYQAAEPEKQITPETAEKLRKRKEKATRERLIVKRSESLRRTERQAPTINDL